MSPNMMDAPYSEILTNQFYSLFYFRFLNSGIGLWALGFGFADLTDERWVEEVGEVSRGWKDRRMERWNVEWNCMRGEERS